MGTVFSILVCLAFSFPIFNIYNKKRYDLDILEHILYGNMTSRLWLALRDVNPIVYGLKVYNYLYEEIGIFRIRLTFSKVLSQYGQSVNLYKKTFFIKKKHFTCKSRDNSLR